MGWAKDSFDSELGRARILPMRSNEYIEYSVRPKLYYYNYDFPTEAQVRALQFITMYTGKIFEGKTKNEAKIFIKDNIEKAKFVKGVPNDFLK